MAASDSDIQLLQEMNCFSQVHDIGLCGIGTLAEAQSGTNAFYGIGERPVAIATSFVEGDSVACSCQMSVLAPHELAIQLDLEQLLGRADTTSLTSSHAQIEIARRQHVKTATLQPESQTCGVCVTLRDYAFSPDLFRPSPDVDGSLQLGRLPAVMRYFPGIYCPFSVAGSTFQVC